MARSAYKSAKRSKELKRQKKQEEKRLRRQGKTQPAEGDGGTEPERPDTGEAWAVEPEESPAEAGGDEETKDETE